MATALRKRERRKQWLAKRGFELAGWFMVVLSVIVILLGFYFADQNTVVMGIGYLLGSIE